MSQRCAVLQRGAVVVLGRRALLGGADGPGDRRDRGSSVLCSGLGESQGRCCWVQPTNLAPSSPCKSELNPSGCVFSEGERHAAALSWGVLEMQYNVWCSAALCCLLFAGFGS